jgi:hypothetical protein
MTNADRIHDLQSGFQVFKPETVLRAKYRPATAG